MVPQQLSEKIAQMALREQMAEKSLPELTTKKRKTRAKRAKP